MSTTPAASQLDPLKQYSNKNKSVKRSQSVSESKRGSTILQAFFGSPNMTSEKKCVYTVLSSYSFVCPCCTDTLRRITCLTCLSDDIPISRSAKLGCSHRMCHKCLKRIFTMSVADPQHMPPRCCTSNHIPLKHVDKLFDTKFKTKWNKKYQEYTTKNRIYCPSRGCGEWIKPSNIHVEYGRKYGKCSRCKTKVCCICNGKWHRGKDCPKDEDTNKFIEVAQQEGWQRCYNCSAMVELKEGCNHITCRCTAEFCIICGAKWKSCECPWFNYGVVMEGDQLNHMNVPEEVRVPVDGNAEAGFRNPIRYQEEIDRRRQQEELDETLARRMQTILNLDEDDDENHNNDEHYSPRNSGDILDFGNANNNFMNEHYAPVTFQEPQPADREETHPVSYRGQRPQRNRTVSSGFWDRPPRSPIYNPIIDSDGSDNVWNSGIVPSNSPLRRENTESPRRRRRLKAKNSGEGTQSSRVERWRMGVATAEWWTAMSFFPYNTSVYTTTTPFSLFFFFAFSFG